ncbi:hypothetical protein GCM10011415_39150 [Salipiger pallidus]|uniref:Uncharacterized protein n=1 Tax=Salipiger pallidus TaxID=1775170 RepID=A0A8J2ZNV7_9RHOB|nr:hypothetical protein [Salipiger pallidus]GGG85155.1 hypothetical protein GCM10011415_39150 [Salipiger pallidus]
MTATAPDVAAVVPTDMQVLVQPMRELAERATRFITVNQIVVGSNFDETEVLTDNKGGGSTVANVMAEFFGRGDEMLVVIQPPSSLARPPTAGFETYDGIDYLGGQDQSDDPKKAAEIVPSTVSARPHPVMAASPQDLLRTVRRSGLLPVIHKCTQSARRNRTSHPSPGSVTCGGR